ncbi:MAG: TatD family hydrolase [Sphingomonadaceae bacterium]
MRLIDSHCHLNYPGLVEDQPGVLARARAAGVALMVNIATKEREWAEVRALAEAQPDVVATVGVHPHEADGHAHVDTARLVTEAAHPKVVGIGETGLDFYYDHSDRARQADSFRAHIAASRETGLPLIVHTRDAEAETAAILREEWERGAFPGLIHCFTASADFARAVLPLGFCISLSGIVTFRKAEALQQVARDLPLDRLLVETDAPFLAPVPHRGRTCEPAHVADTARFVAALRGMEPEALAEATTANFYRLFTRAPH